MIRFNNRKQRYWFSYWVEGHELRDFSLVLFFSHFGLGIRVILYTIREYMHGSSFGIVGGFSADVEVEEFAKENNRNELDCTEESNRRERRWIGEVCR